MSTDSLESWLRRWLPRDATRVVSLGELAAWVHAGLPAGIEVEPATLSSTAPSTGTSSTGTSSTVATSTVATRTAVPGTVVLACAPADAGETEALLHRAARILAPRGRLLLLGRRTGDPGTTLDVASLERSLLESGYVPREASMDDAGDRLAADYDGYTISPYRAGDEDEILELFRRAFHVARDRDHWSWKYEANPHGSRHVSLARDPEGRLIGQYCAYPVRFFRGGHERTVHQVGDTMTAAEVRSVGRGPTSILARAARHFYAAFCRGRVELNYGFNTGNIQKFSIRFVGATKVEEVPYRERDLALRPPRPRPRRFGGYRTVRSPTPRQLDSLWRRARRDYGALVVRDSAYLDWRYLDCPDQHYTLLGARRWGRLLGWGVFTRRGDHLVWGDLLVARRDADCLEWLLAEAVRLLAPGQPPRKVVGWFPPRPPWLHERLEALGFEARAEPQSLGLMVVPFEDLAAPEHCARGLFYTYGDSDLF